MPIPCPACGFLTLTQGFYRSYTLCPVCDGKDDGVQLANPASGCGANRDSLGEAQALALARFPLGSGQAKGFSRARDWRPLSPFEMATAAAERAEKHWKNRDRGA